MNDRDLRHALRDVELDAGAEARVWDVVAAAHRAREPLPRRRGRRRAVVAVAAAVAAAAAAAALTSPGRALVRTVREAIGIETPVARHATLARLPVDRSLLVDSASGAWLVRPTGALRRLGDYRQTTWSPRGLFVAAVRGDELRALEPDGTVRWRLVRPAAVAWPRWSPSGFRIAYKQGRTLRVVAGDGTGDARVATGVPAAVPALAWQPGTDGHRLAYAGPSGRVVLVDTDARRARWAVAGDGRVRDLCFAGDGRALVVLRARVVAVLDARTGASLARIAIPPGRAAIACASVPGSRFALAHRPAGAPDQSVVVLADATGRRLRVLFRGTGRVDGLAFAGRALIASWPSTDQWLFLPLAQGEGIAAVGRVRSLFGADEGPVPTIGGVCCDDG